MTTETWERPKAVDRITALVGATSVEGLLPPWESIPEAFRRGRDPWCKAVHKWFFEGLKKGALRARDGVDQGAALAHCSSIMRSFEPRHEHKIAGVAFLCSLWFEPTNGGGA